MRVALIESKPSRNKFFELFENKVTNAYSFHQNPNLFDQGQMNLIFSLKLKFIVQPITWEPLFIL